MTMDDGIQNAPMYLLYTITLQLKTPVSPALNQLAISTAVNTKPMQESQQYTATAGYG